MLTTADRGARPHVGTVRLALRLLLGAIAEIQAATVAYEDLRASERRWIRIGFALGVLRAVGSAGEWALRIPRGWAHRLARRFGLDWDVVLEQWASIGRFEELAGRELLHDLGETGWERAADELVARPELYEVVDDVVAHLASGPPELARLVQEITLSLVHDPDVKALIHEQSTSLLGTAVERVRGEAARADSALERALARIEHRLNRD